MLISYSIISSILLLCGFIAYRVAMSGQCQHSLNRQALLTVYSVAILGPLIILAVLLHHTDHTAGSGIEIGDITGFAVPGTDKAPERTISITTIYATAMKVYVSGCIVCAAYFIFGLLILLFKIRKGESTYYGTFTLIIMEDSFRTSPFSWGRSIVMNRHDFDEDGDMILLHEHAHLIHYHWVDLIVAYAAICLQWYNPAAWAMREELKAVHEYQADESVLATGTEMKRYQMMLLKKAAGYGYQSLANSLNHSKLKKRVTMMYKKKTSAKRKMFALALVPAIGFGIAVTAMPSVAGVLESLAESSIVKTSRSSSEDSGDTKKDKKVFDAVEEIAEYPGGMDALIKYLMSNIRYPESAKKADIQGRVIVKFVIDEDGSISDAEIVRRVSPELDAEALRVVNEMPKWIPAKVNGKTVASHFTLPVQFQLEADKKEDTAKTQ